MTRPPFLARLTVAAVLDAARVMAALSRWVLLDPVACRALGHNPQALYDDERTRVAVTCLRCGRDVEV